MNFDRLTAKDLMTRDVLTVEASATLQEAARLMAQRHVHCLLVPSSDPTRCGGVITTKDIVQVLCEADPSALSALTVADVMSAPTFGVQQGFAVRDCIQLMRRAGVRSAPVLDGTTVVGLLSFTDVLQVVAAL
jgi:CBS domain-containing protein